MRLGWFGYWFFAAVLSCFCDCALGLHEQVFALLFGLSLFLAHVHQRVKRGFAQFFLLLRAALFDPALCRSQARS